MVSKNIKAWIARKNGNFLIGLPDGSVHKTDSGMVKSFLLNFGKMHLDRRYPKCGEWEKPFCVEGDREPLQKEAALSKDGVLSLYDPGLMNLLADSVQYISVQEYAAAHGKSPSRIKTHCQNHRIAGVIKIGGRYAIPKDAPYPADERITAKGKYIGVRKRKRYTK